MIKAPSVQSKYTLVWSKDPALELPEHVDDPALTAEENETARKRVDENRERLLKTARLTGDWTPITRPGERPTFFTFDHMSHTEFSWVEGEAARRQLGPLEINDLFFLVAIRDITNFGDFKLERRRAAQIDGTREHVWMATPKVLDHLQRALSEIEDGARSLVNEFVIEIIRRARGVIDPL